MARGTNTERESGERDGRKGVVWGCSEEADVDQNLRKGCYEWITGNADSRLGITIKRAKDGRAFQIWE